MKDMLLALGAMLLLLAYGIGALALSDTLIHAVPPVVGFVGICVLFPASIFIYFLWRQGWHWSETTPDPPATSEPHSHSPDSKQ